MRLSVRLLKLLVFGALINVVVAWMFSAATRLEWGISRVRSGVLDHGVPTWLYSIHRRPGQEEDRSDDNAPLHVVARLFGSGLPHSEHVSASPIG